MISGQLPEIDFSKIRTLGPSKNKGFEELTVQLFRSTFPKETKFYRVDDAGGDGGVEDIAFGTGSTKIGLQAKYFDKLDSTQWTQINKSVRTALKTHFPDLVEYRIATPVNRSKTKKTWSNYEQKWDDYAAELGYTNKVKFTWQGETELRNDLMQAAHKSKVYYWFGCPHFTEHWLKAKYESCKKVLDARYTPEHHVRTDCEQILDAFFLTDRLVQTFMKKWKSLITASQECIVSCQDVSLKSQIADLQLAVESLKLVPQTSIPGSSEIRAVLEKINIQIADIYSFYLSTRLEQETVREPDKRDQYHIRPYANELGKLDEINESIEALYSFITKYKIYDKQLTLVTGEAGTGKSHLLAKAIERALARKQPCL
ncbi:MAG: hypothetical protein A2Y12_19505 [Planctomycetes bacterium GWF2_42_9]|nr:MAG: hypothetical protein A2Y12_19505 [Planctomycetes bacterium GWF2_42_9]